jgi:hypothetical protein
MKYFTLKDPPPNFHQTTIVYGERWLANNSDPKKRPRDYWSIHRDYLAECFNNLCGYTIMRMGKCTFDHYLSCDNHRSRAYQWDNYRYVCNSVNSSKKRRDTEVLDPFEIEHNWFAVLIPSFQLVVTDHVPTEQKQRAELTVTVLNLSKGFAAYRRQFYKDFLNGNASVKTLQAYAPLIADAVVGELQQIASGLPFQNDPLFEQFLQGEIMLTALSPQIQQIMRQMLPPADPPARQPLQKRRAGQSRGQR